MSYGHGRFHWNYSIDSDSIYNTNHYDIDKSMTSEETGPYVMAGDFDGVAPDFRNFITVTS